MVTIRLLGRPGVEFDGAPARAPRGHKAWAVLAYLLLAQRPATRAHLARILFGDANDPLGALRWTLSELRRTLGVRISGDPMTLRVDASTQVDVCRIESADPAALLELSGELLDGIELDAHPEFESWLGVARHRVTAAIESRRRQVALALLSSGRGSEAVAHAERMVADNPFVEANHELLVRALAMTGDRAAAERHVQVCEDLFRRDLGIMPSAALREAANARPDGGTAARPDRGMAAPPHGGSAVRPVGGRSAVLAHLDAGRAAILAGAFDVGLRCLRRAVAEADRHGDSMLRARSLTALGSALVHTVRGGDEEGAVMLRRGARLASDAGDCATALWAYRELAFVDVQAGRRESARQWLDLATPLATTDGERAGILGVRGMDASDAGDYPNAFVHLGASVDYALRAGDERQAAWSLSLIGRAHLLRGEHRLARKALARSAELVDKQRWLAFQPWPQALQGELDLHGGDWKAATNRLEQAWTLACQVEDPCWESISARGLGLLHAAGGDPRGAGEWLTESTTRARRTSDRYVWMLGHALDAATAHAIQSHDHDRAARLVADLTALASRASMRELLVRAHLHRHSLGDSTALPTARRLAADIDNPALHDALRG